MLFAGISKAYIKRLTGIIVRPPRTSAMRFPLVGIDADEYADRFYSQRTGDIYNSIIAFRIRNRSRSSCYMRILRGGGAGSGICLGSGEFQTSQRVATQITTYSIICCVLETACQLCSVIGLRLIIGNDQQFLLIIDVDVQIAFIPGNLICIFRRGGCSVQIGGMMIHIAVRSFILQRIRIAFFHISQVGIMDRIPIHVQILHINPGWTEANVLERDDIVFQTKRLSLHLFGRFIFLSEDILITGLRRQIGCIYIRSHFQDTCGCSINCYCLRFSDLDLRFVFQNINDCICQFWRYLIIIEDNGIWIFIKWKTYRFGCFVCKIICYSWRFFRDFLAFCEFRICDHLIVPYFVLSAFHIIMDGIADRILRPAGV